MNWLQVGLIALAVALAPHAEAACGGTLGGTSGNFQSPNYPQADFNLDCQWKIVTSQYRRISLKLLAFSSEPNDVLMIHDGNTTAAPVLAIVSGTYAALPWVRSSGDSLLARFITNNKVDTNGFEANYYSVDNCTYVITDSNGTIQSPNVLPDNYEGNLLCTWQITAPLSDQRLRLTFTRVNTERNYDIITVFDGTTGSAPILAVISGASIPAPIETTSKSVFIRFETDSTVFAPGFQANFLAVN